MHYATEPTIKPEGATVHYIIDTKGSTFTVRAFATGLLSALGHSPTIAIPDFEGEVFLNPDAVEQSSLRMVIQAASLTVTDDISEKDREEINRRMHDEVLEADSFPDIVYECSRGVRQQDRGRAILGSSEWGTDAARSQAQSAGVGASLGER